MRQRLARLPLGMIASYIGGLGVRGVETIGKLGLYVVIGRQLGARDAGLFFLCMTWMMLVATPSRMGLERAMTRHVAAELAVGAGRAARRAAIEGTFWATLGALGAAAFTAVVAYPAARFVFHQLELARPLLLTAVAVVPYSLMILLGYLLAGLKRGIGSQVVQTALWPVAMLAILWAGPRGINAALIALAIACVIAVVLAVVLIVIDRAKFRDQPHPPGVAHEALPGIWTSARSFMVVEIVQVSLASLPVLILGAFASPAQVGAFSIANRASMLIWVVIISIGIVVSPFFAEHHRRHEMAALRSINRLTRLSVAAVGAPVAVAMIAAPQLLLGLVGADFVIGSTALRLLAMGQLVNCLLPCQDVLLAMTGHGQVLRLLNLLQLATCLVLGAVLIPLFGMAGAAVLVMLCIAQGAIGTTLAVRRLEPAAF